MPDKYKEVVVAIIFVGLLFMVLSGIMLFLILFYQKRRAQHNQEMLVLQSTIQQELLKTQLETQEMTFQQIAEEIHDNVGQLLNTVKNMLGILDRSLPPGEYKILSTSMHTLGHAIEELRAMSKSLNKEWLDQFNVIENLRLEIDRMNATGVAAIKLYAEIDFIPLKAEEQIMLFRIMQEALQNCVKHSNAVKIDIYMQIMGDKFIISIADDGTGFDAEKPRKSGIGLINMRNRTRMLGGTITWLTNNMEGTQVNIVLPVKSTII